MNKLRKIPLHKQDARAAGGLDMRMLPEDYDTEPYTLGEHRDDYYVLVILAKGSGVMRCDMEDVKAKAPGLLIMKPYQVHSAASTSLFPQGYFMSIAPFLIPDHCSSVFRNLSASQQFLKISQEEKKELMATASLLYRAFSEQDKYKSFIVNGLFTALVSRVASLFAESGATEMPGRNQSQVIASGFRKLLSEHSFLESPAFFAGKLNITTSHLNDCVHAVTGFSVTHWLQDAMTLEAKRNLYYTDNHVKEIAFALGFGDHAYFSRLFRKITGETPLEFRKRFRE